MASNPKSLHTTESIEEMVRTAASKHRFQPELHEGLAKQIMADATLNQLPHDKLSLAIDNAFSVGNSHWRDRVKQSNGTFDFESARKFKAEKIHSHTIGLDDVSKAHSDLKRTAEHQPKADPSRVEQLRQRAKNAGVAPKEGGSEISFLERLSTEQKVYGGMSALVAGMSALGAYTSLKNAVTKDADGKSHVQMSNVAIGIASLLLTAGLLWTTHETLKAPQAVQI